MHRSSTLAAAVLGLLLLGAAAPPPGGAGAGASDTPRDASTPARGVVAYYLHVDVRCQTCLLIEQRSREVLDAAFGRELQDGTLVWNVVNTQQPGNRRSISALGLPARGLVLVEYRGGTPGRHRNLDGVWEHIHGDPAVFRQYLTREVRAFLDDKE